jgi:catechol 2,3-dioxygenase-like lactoylglutathione lyase family enzyme
MLNVDPFKAPDPMIIPTVRVTDMARAVDFYTRVLDFDHIGSWPAMAMPAARCCCGLAANYLFRAMPATAWSGRK